MTANKAVPNAPTSKPERALQLQLSLQRLLQGERTPIAKKPTAMPKSTQRKAGVTVMTAVICKNAAITPIIKAATNASGVQLHLHSQFKNAI